MAVTSARPSTTIQRTAKSLLPFLKEFTNIQLFDACYIPVGPILPGDLAHFKTAVGDVKSYRVVKESGKEPVVSAGVFAQVVSALNGEPFFPNLTHVYVKDLENFLKHYPFLLSSKVESVSAVVSYSWVSTRGSVGAFIQALVAFAPQLRFLNITHTKWTLKISHISAINHLTCLRSLEISRLADVQRTADIFLFLKALVNLEELRLTLGEPVQTWSPDQKACLSPPPDKKILPTGSSHLPSLKSLIITGPSQIISEFLDCVGSPNLVSLSLVSTCWLHVKQPAQPRNEPSDASGCQTRLPDQPSDLQPAEPGSQVCTAACTSSHHHEWNLTRWSKTLENLTISSCDRTFFDLSSISKHEALKNLDIKGDSTPPFTVLLASGTPTFQFLRMLNLSFPDSNLTLFELNEIALHSPNLSRLSSSFYIGSELELDSFADIEPLSHQLEELTMNRAILKDVGNSTLHFASKIALHLHLLFPKLKRFNYLPDDNESGSKFWEDVWYIMQLSQKVAQHAKQHHSIAANVNEASVMTDSYSTSPHYVL